MTSERHQMLAGLDSRNFAAPIRQIQVGIAAHAIGTLIASVLTQPGPKADHPGSKADGQRAAHKWWPWFALVLEGPEHGRTIPLPVIGLVAQIDLI
jgi:hypothetical protein